MQERLRPLTFEVNRFLEEHIPSSTQDVRVHCGESLHPLFEALNTRCNIE